MNVLELSLALMLLLFAILGSGVWIALALAVCGFAAVMTKVATPAGQVLATSMWTASKCYARVAVHAWPTGLSGYGTDRPSARARS